MAHAPAALQLLVPLHALPSSLQVVPTGRLEQVPGLPPGKLQVWHSPAQALLQQTPSTQFPDMQSPAVSVVQRLPFGSFALHLPVLRQAEPTQSASEAHDVAH